MTGCTAFKGSGGFRSEPERMEFTAIFIDASKEKFEGNFEAAIHLYEKCLKINPKSAAAHYDLAGIYIKTQQSELALKNASQAYEFESSNKWYLIRYALVLKLRNDFDLYQTILRKGIKSFPDEERLQADLIDNLILTNKFEDAIKELDKLEKQKGVKEYTSVQKASLYIELGAINQAEKEYLRLLEEKNTIKNLLYLAKFYKDSNQDEKSFEYYNLVLDKDALNPEANFALYEYYSERSIKLKAIKFLHIAFKSESMNIDRKIKLIFSFYESSMDDDSLNKEVFQLLDILEKAHSDDPKPYAVYGDFLFRDKKAAEAKKKFLKSLSIDPNRFPIWRQVILIDNELADYSSMIVDAEDAISYFPSHPEMYWFKAVAEYQLKDYEDALSSLETGSAFIVDNDVFMSQFQSLIGTINNELKDYKASDVAFEKAIDLDPKNSLVLNNYAYYLSLRKEKLISAEKYIRRAIDLNPKEVNYLDTYGWILYHQERYDQALIVLLESHDLGGKNNPTVLEHIAEVYLMLGQEKKAIEFYHKAIDKGGDKSLIFEKIISNDHTLDK